MGSVSTSAQIYLLHCLKSNAAINLTVETHFKLFSIASREQELCSILIHIIFHSNFCHNYFPCPSAPSAEFIIRFDGTAPRDLLWCMQSLPFFPRSLLGRSAGLKLWACQLPRIRWWSGRRRRVGSTGMPVGDVVSYSSD